jgi:hypothetical protein
VIFSSIVIQNSLEIDKNGKITLTHSNSSDDRIGWVKEYSKLLELLF